MDWGCARGGRPCSPPFFGPQQALQEGTEAPGAITDLDPKGAGPSCCHPRASAAVHKVPGRGDPSSAPASPPPGAALPARGHGASAPTLPQPGSN